MTARPLFHRIQGWLLPGVVLLLVGSSLYKRYFGTSGTIPAGTILTAAPIADLRTGERTDLAALAASGPVALHIFATWCGACMREWPALDGYGERYAEHFRLIPIGLDEPAALNALLRRSPTELPVYVGGNEVEQALAVRIYPYTVFVDTDLRVLHDHSGILNPTAFRKAVERLRAGPQEPPSAGPESRDAASRGPTRGMCGTGLLFSTEPLPPVASPEPHLGTECWSALDELAPLDPA